MHTDHLKIRKRIASLKSDLAALAASPVNHAESRSILDAWCADRAAEGDAQMAQRLAPCRTGERLDDLLAPMFPASMVSPDMTCVLASLIGPIALADKLWRHVADTESGPTAAERAERGKALSARLAALEIDDETHVLQSEAEGHPVARRGDADPRAVLASRSPALQRAEHADATLASDAPAPARMARSTYLKKDEK